MESKRIMAQAKEKSPVRSMLNKVPEVTALFWVIKIMATTVGETAADFLNQKLNLGSSGTTVLMIIALLAALVFQFRARSYVPGIYWLVVVLISVVGTLITDTLVDTFHISLWTTTAIFTVGMFTSFGVWYAVEKTLSIHAITTTRREIFYWTSILFTFALGTAAGDLIAEKLALGYWRSGLLFAGLIGLVAIGRFVFKLNEVAAFWIAYVLTRPLGASIGDFLTAPKADGGLAIPTTVITAVFLTTILAIVGYFTQQQRKSTQSVSLDELEQPIS